MRIAQAIGIEALVGLSFAAGEAHITFSLDSGRHYRARRFQLFHPLRVSINLSSGSMPKHCCTSRWACITTCGFPASSTAMAT